MSEKSYLPSGVFLLCDKGVETAEELAARKATAKQVGKELETASGQARKRNFAKKTGRYRYRSHAF